MRDTKRPQLKGEISKVSPDFIQKSLKRFGRMGQRAATAFVQLITWPLLRFALLVSPLYPILKWFVSVVILSLVLGLFTTYIAEGFNLTILKPTAEFIGAHRNFMLLAIGVCFVLFFVARVGHMRRETQRRLGAAFSIYSPAEELSLADLGFRESQPQEPERRETHRQERPFFGTYFPRTMLEDTESTDADTGMRREFTEEDLQQHIRDGRRFLLLDHLYSGKTLTLFHIVRRIRGYTVVSPDDSQPVPDEETFALLKGRRVVILLDLKQV